MQPLAGDWRERVKPDKPGRKLPRPPSGGGDVAGGEGDAAAAAAAAKPASRGAAAAKAKAAGSCDGVPDLDALSEGLPSGWRAMWDKSRKMVYFGHLASQVGTGRCATSALARPSAHAPLASSTAALQEQTASAAALQQWAPVRLPACGHCCAPCQLWLHALSNNLQRACPDGLLGGRRPAAWRSARKTPLTDP